MAPLVIWPERSELQISMPVSFRSKFGCKITAVIDCLDLFIDRPSNLQKPQYCKISHWYYSSSKNLFHFKGRTSDQFITENSNFQKYVQYVDVIMADRGFNIAETLGTFWAKLKIPSFTKGQSELRPEEV